jgi:hypothetical protein
MAESVRNGAALEQAYLAEGGKVRLLTFQDLDNRTLAARRVRETEQAIAEDLGGAARLSEGQRQLARRVAILGSILESVEVLWATGQEFDLGQYLATVNCHRRVLRTLGLERRTRPANLIEMMGEADG